MLWVVVRVRPLGQTFASRVKRCIGYDIDDPDSLSYFSFAPWSFAKHLSTMFGNICMFEHSTKLSNDVGRCCIGYDFWGPAKVGQRWLTKAESWRRGFSRKEVCYETDNGAEPIEKRKESKKQISQLGGVGWWRVSVRRWMIHLQGHSSLRQCCNHREAEEMQPTSSCEKLSKKHDTTLDVLVERLK